MERDLAHEADMRKLRKQHLAAEDFDDFGPDSDDQPEPDLEGEADDREDFYADLGGPFESIP